MMTANTLVHLVDDDPLALRAVSWFLESAGVDVSTYSTGEEFLARYVPSAAAECIVLDLRMPGLSGLDVQRKLVENGIVTPVIFVSGHGRVPDAVAAMKAGAFEFLEKPCTDDALLERIRAALERDEVLREEAGARASIEARLSSLTNREHQVAVRVAAGMANKVIAADLGISARTVEVYRAKAMAKTGARSIAELVRLLVRQEDGSSPS